MVNHRGQHGSYLIDYLLKMGSATNRVLSDMNLSVLLSVQMRMQMMTRRQYFFSHIDVADLVAVRRQL